MIEIWYRHADEPPERIATASTPRHADDLIREYAVSFGVAEGMYRHGQDKLWAGTQWEEP